MRFKTSLGKIVELTPERRAHIIEKHPIVKRYLVHLREILKDPNDIRYSKYTHEVLLFYKYFDKIESGKYIVVVVNMLEGKVKTTYVTNRIKEGRKYETEKN